MEAMIWACTRSCATDDSINDLSDEIEVKNNNNTTVNLSILPDFLITPIKRDIKIRQKSKNPSALSGKANN